MVRLDAIGYAVKTPGSSCFLTPETDRFIADLSAEAHRLGLGVLTEVHAPYRYAVELAGAVDRVYDFALAPLVLHALLAADIRPLRDWLAHRPHNAVTVLETHDGIGMVDAGPDYAGEGRSGLLTERQLLSLATRISRNSAGTAVALETPAGGLYRVDCTILDALAGDERRYLLARLIQFCTPGIHRSTTSGCWRPQRRGRSSRPRTAARSTAATTAPRRSTTRCGGRWCGR